MTAFKLSIAKIVFALALIFPAGQLLAQVAVIDASTSNTATAEAHQRKTVYDTINQRFWAFYFDGSAIKFRHSVDGISWASGGTIVSDFNDFDVEFVEHNGVPYVFVVGRQGDSDVSLTRAVASASALSFERPKLMFESFSSSVSYSKPTIAIDSSKRVWVAAVHDQGSAVVDRYQTQYTRSVDAVDGALNVTTAPAEIGPAASLPTNPVLISQPANEMLLIQASEESNITAFRYNGSQWLDENAGGESRWFSTFEQFSKDSPAYTVDAMDSHDGQLYAIGDFTGVFGASTSNVARFDGSKWHPVGPSFVSSFSAAAIKVISSDDIYVGGEGGDHLYHWDGSSWTGIPKTIPVLAIDAVSSTQVAVGLSSHSTRAPILQIWNGSDWSTPHPFANFGKVNAVKYDGSRLYVGGDFDGLAARARPDNMGYLEGGSFHPMVSSNNVNAIAVYKGQVYIGGRRGRVDYGTMLDGLLRWDGSKFIEAESVPFAQRFQDHDVHSLLVHDGDLYFGGNFNNANGVSSADGVARFDGTDFHSLGSGVVGTVSTLGFLDRHLFASKITGVNGQSSFFTHGLSRFGPSVATDKHSASGFSVVGDTDGDAHLVYRDSSNSLIYRHFDYGSLRWQPAVKVRDSLLVGDAVIAQDRVSKQIYATWPEGDSILFSEAPATDFSQWELTPRTLAERTTSTLNIEANGGNDKIIATWTRGSSAPYNVESASIDISPAEIQISGNGNPITSGSTTPSASNNSDFGSADVSARTVTKSFLIENAGQIPLYLDGSPLVQISGAHAGDFSLNQLPSTAVDARGGTTSFSIDFNPSSLGLRTAQISVSNSDTDESLYTFAISGEGVDAPEIAVEGNSTEIIDGDRTPSTSDHTEFGSSSVVDGSPIARAFTIANIGGATLTLSGSPHIEISGANASDFSVTAQPSSASIPSLSSTTFTVAFDPSDVGSRSAIVSIFSDDSDEPVFDFAVNGTGFSPEISVSGTSFIDIPDGTTTTATNNGTNYGSVELGGASKENYFRVTSRASYTLNLTGSPIVEIVGADASDFTVTTQPNDTSLGVFQSVIFRITFTPSKLGLHSATVRILNNDHDETEFDFAVQGIGASPEISLTSNGSQIVSGDSSTDPQNGTNFGKHNVQTGSKENVFLVSNLGSSNLLLNGSPRVSISGANASDFSVSLMPDASIAANDSSQFKITFNPSASGQRRATVSIANNDIDESTFTFALVGEGIEPEIDIRGNGISIMNTDSTPSITDNTNFGEVATTRETVEKTFVILNLGTDKLNLSGTPHVTISGKAASDFTVKTQASSPINRLDKTMTNSSSFVVEFSPSSSGVRSAFVNILSDDADESPYTFAIRGTGVEPEIVVKGNDTTIANEQTVAVEADKTQFGLLDVVGGYLVHTFTIDNIGTDSLELGAITISGSQAEDFEVVLQPLPATLETNEQTSFQIAFNPIGVGLHSAIVSIENSDLDEAPFTFVIEGTGIAPAMRVLGNGVELLSGETEPNLENHTAFGRVDTDGANQSRVFLILNNGSDSLNLGSIPPVTIEGENASDFSIVSMPQARLMPDIDVGVLLVEFNPSAVGIRKAVISIESDDPDKSEFTFNISGTGVFDSDDDGNTDDLDDDDDNDGVSDSQELVDGTDPHDSGSTLEYMGDSVCVDWNGYLAFLTQVFELRNTSDTNVKLNVTLYNLNREAQGNLSFELQSKRQYDLILNNFVGFESNTYGVACAQIVEGPTESLGGQLSVYRLTEDSYSLSYAVPFTQAKAGQQFAGFNFYQPSQNSFDANNSVNGWLELTNTEDEAQIGELRVYRASGSDFNSQTIILQPGERRDLAVHEAASSKIGLVEWRPRNAEAKFRMRLNRYYYGANGLSDLVAVAPLNGSKGNGRALDAVIDTKGRMAVVELSNTSASSIQVRLSTRSMSGALTEKQPFKLLLPSKATIHVLVNDYIVETLGQISVQSNSPNSLIASLLEYRYDTDKSLQSVSAIKVSESLKQTLIGSYNSFLDQECTARIANTNSSEQAASITMTRYDGTRLLEEEISLRGNSVTEIDLCIHEPEAAYGEVRVESTDAKSLSALISRRNKDETAEFIVSMQPR